MSTSSIDSSSGLTSNSTLTNSGAGGLLQVTGLASGLNTNAIIQAEMSEQELPISNMETEISGLQAERSQLTSIQSALQTVSLDAQALNDPALFAPVQGVTSTDSNLITAASTGGIGGVIGSSTVDVTSLASAAQRTFTFASPTSADTITIDGQPVSLNAGDTSTTLAQDINSDSTMDVWASATSSGQLVLSSRTTGDNGDNYIQVSDPGGALTEQTALAQNGTDAEYSINGVAGSSPTDTVTGAIPGVTLTLNGVTSSTDPVTVSVQPPAADATSILAAVNQFVSDYNSSINSIESVVNTAPASESNSTSYDPNSGSLFGDNELESLLSNMRTTMYSPGAGLPSGMSALSDIGISTGAASASGYTQTSVSGDLVVNTAALTAAIQSNPDGVQAVLQQWSSSFQTVVSNEAGPGGSLDSRIQGDGTMVTDLQTQYSAMQTLFQQQEKDMEEQWAQVEATLSKLQNAGTSLSGISSASASASSEDSSSSSSSSSSS